MEVTRSATAGSVKYVCSYRDCRFSPSQCRRVHLDKNVDSMELREELRQINDTKKFESSSLLMNIYTIAKENGYNSIETVENIRKHVEDVCGITYLKEQNERDDTSQ